MQITADISKIWNTVKCDLIFIFNVLLGSATGFAGFFCFFWKWGDVTIRNYAETCQGICDYNLVYNFFVYVLQLERLVFLVRFSNAL